MQGFWQGIPACTLAPVAVGGRIFSLPFFFFAPFFFSVPLVLWSPGPLVPWSSGPVVLWSRGPLVFWVPWSGAAPWSPGLLKYIRLQVYLAKQQI